MKINFFSIFFLRVLIVNFTGIIFLHDTVSFNIGLFSIQSILYSLNSILLYVFLFIETVFSYLQYYGLDFEFINLILLDLNNIDFDFASLVILEKYNYLLFIILNLIILLNLNYIIEFFINKKNFIIDHKFLILIILIFLLVLFFFAPFDLNKKISKKIINFESTFKQYSILRNDNWYISLKTYLNYKDNQKSNKSNNLFLKDFSDILVTNKYDNIFIILNESYPNFKNKSLNEKLFQKIIGNNQNQIVVSKFKKNWNKKYSTQGAELNLFCGDNDNFFEFKKKNLENFINDNDCYFKNYKKLNKTFIHSYKLNSFNRGRYSGFFDKIYTLDNLKDLNIKMCDGSFYAICDHLLLDHIRELAFKENNLVIFLTVNNHIPPALILETDLVNCKDHHPLNINQNICYSFHNQALFNSSLSNFISKLKKNELLLFYSDTPPLFPVRERIHFEDYIDVYTFEKK